MLAPLSGKIFNDVGIGLVVLSLEAGVSVAFISVISAGLDGILCFFRRR